jgi:hypothetical protein
MCQAQRRMKNWTVHQLPAAGPIALNSRIPAQMASRWARSVSGSFQASCGDLTPTFLPFSWISVPLTRRTIVSRLRPPPRGPSRSSAETREATSSK